MQDISYTVPETTAGEAQVQVPFTLDGTACSGRQALLQQALMYMFTDPGDPARVSGGGMIQQLQGSGMSQSLAMNLATAAAGAARLFMQTEQARQAARGVVYADDEKLSDIRISALSADKGTNTVDMTVEVVTVSGAVAEASVSVPKTINS